MAKQKPLVKMHSYGIYSQWDGATKDLPQIQTFTTEVLAEIDVEFGFIVNIKKARGELLQFCIEHPGILDEQGQQRSPFTGEEYVRSNDWNFYLGDTIWPPISDKLGPWRMSIDIAGKRVAEKTFDVYQQPEVDEFNFFSRRSHRS